MGDTSTQREWLVVVLVYNNSCYDIEKPDENPGYIKMEQQKNSLFSAIEDSQFSERIKIFIVEARIGVLKSDNKIHQRISVSEKEGHNFKDWLKFQESNLGFFSDQSGVSGILGRIVKENPAQRNMVITFGHGSVFGINYLPAAQITQGGVVAHNKNGGAAPVEKGKTDGFNVIDTLLPDGLVADQLHFLLDKKRNMNLTEIRKDQQALNLLTNIELSNAIKDVYGREDGSKKLDMLVMYNCLMQNLFSQYELRNAVDFLVAPISGICHPGYNYREIFVKLCDRPAMLSRELAGIFLDTADKNRKSSHEDFLPDIRQTWKLYAVQLDKVLLESIQALFADLMEKVFELQKTEPNVLYSLRLTNRQLFNYAQYSLPEIKIVDLAILLEFWNTKMEQFAALHSLKEPVEKLKTELGKMDTFPFTGSQFYDTTFHFVDKELATGVKTGFGFWFPDTTPRKGNIVFNEILHPGPLKDLVPSFVRDTRYAAVFTEFIARFG